MGMMKTSQELHILSCYPLWKKYGSENETKKAKNYRKKECSGNSALKKVNKQGNLFSLLKEKTDKGSDHDPIICTQESIFLWYPSLQLRQKHYCANHMISDFLGFGTEIWVAL